jgi:hypothetical protein
LFNEDERFRELISHCRAGLQLKELERDHPDVQNA